MKLVTLAQAASPEVLTMSSLEMVSYINSTRKPGDAPLTHANFLAKVVKVLGATSHSFECDVPDSYGRPRRTYNFPKREAMLMAMSYSYELQAQIFDAWETAEAALVKAKTPALIPNFDNPIEAAEAWIAEKKKSLYLINAISEAKPKVEFHDAVVADLDTYSLSHAAKILGIPPHSFNRTLRAGGYLMDDNVAYQRYINAGYFLLQYSGYILDNGNAAKPATRVTSKGVAYLSGKFANAFA